MIYDIVTRKTIIDLKNIVCERLASGWKLQGGVAVEIIQYNTFYHQAMTLDEFDSPAANLPPMERIMRSGRRLAEISNTTNTHSVN